MPKCSECSDEFETEQGLKIHVGMEHKGVPASEKLKGHDNAKGHTHSDEAKQQIAQATKRRWEENPESFGDRTGENNSMYGVTGDDAPLAGLTGKDHPAYGKGPSQVHVEETGHTVDSEWEAKIDKLLHNHGINYEYQPGPFDLGNRTYTADFRIDNIIIEVKGYSWRAAEDRAKSFMEQYPDFTYVVIGADIPSDVRLTYTNRKQLIDLVKSRD